MQIDKKEERDDAFFYGPWAWIAGFVAAGLLIYFMFMLADGFTG